jgi:hypothetical protein
VCVIRVRTAICRACATAEGDALLHALRWLRVPGSGTRVSGLSAEGQSADKRIYIYIYIYIYCKLCKFYIFLYICRCTCFL